MMANECASVFGVFMCLKLMKSCLLSMCVCVCVCVSSCIINITFNRSNDSEPLNEETCWLESDCGIEMEEFDCDVGRVWSIRCRCCWPVRARMKSRIWMIHDGDDGRRWRGWSCETWTMNGSRPYQTRSDIMLAMVVKGEKEMRENEKDEVGWLVDGWAQKKKRKQKRRGAMKWVVCVLANLSGKCVCVRVWVCRMKNKKRWHTMCHKDTD